MGADLPAFWRAGARALGLSDRSLPAAAELAKALQQLESYTAVERPLAKLALSGADQATLKALLLIFVARYRWAHQANKPRFITPNELDPLTMMLGLLHSGLGDSLLLHDIESVQAQILEAIHKAVHGQGSPAQSLSAPPLQRPTLANAILCGCSVTDAKDLFKAGFEGYTLRSSKEETIDALTKQSNEHWLTIIIPTLKKEATQAVLNSIAKQSEKNITVLVLHCDEKPLGHQEIADVPASNTGGGAIEIINIPLIDRGLYDAMNLGLRLAKTPWVYFIGDDDALASEEVLKEMKRTLDAAPTDCPMVYGNVQMVGGGHGSFDGQLYAYQFDYQKLLDKPICHQAIFYRTENLRAAGGFNLEYPVCADWEANIRLWNKGSEPIFTEITVAKFARGGMSSETYDDLFFERQQDIWTAHR